MINKVEMAVVLINNTVKKYLLAQPKKFRERIREKFEFLEIGIWEGRLRAKKLRKVSSKCVFEAPVDNKNRLLFTLGRHGETAEKSLVIYIWGVVTHDQLSKKSRNIVPDNVPFLNFHDFVEIDLEDIDMEELDSSCFTQEQITEKTREESGNQRWFSVDKPEWKRIQRFTRDEFELFLYLTPEQRAVLGSNPPILVSGTAGSGKTTLSVYYLLQNDFLRKKKIFITYNRSLKNFAERLYKGLVNEVEWSSEIISPDFYTFVDFSLELAQRFGKSFIPDRKVDLNRFSKMFSSHPLHQKFDSALVWEEIRSIIKGALPQVNTSVLEKTYKAIRRNEIDPGLAKQLQQQFILFSKLDSLKAVGRYVDKYLKTSVSSFSSHMDRYLKDKRYHERILSILDRTLEFLKKQRDTVNKKYLSFLEYELLGKKKAPNFPFSRKEIYRIFEWYQDRLEKDDLWDELDLTREALKIFSEIDPYNYSYDVLACDEVQDLTDIQIGLLFDTVHNPEDVFLAGDTKQIINPSGFRWEEVKRHFYERGLEVPEPHYLTLNFRSSGSIVELSNLLLGLKERYLGVKAEEIKEDWKYKGRPVSVVTGIGEGDILEILRVAGARRTVLVRTEEEKDRLQRLLETELVFTISEAKGLEFDTVVLWKFCDDQLVRDVWKIILDLSKRSIHEAKIRHEINLLYVGITRSQNDLIIYDGENPSLIWENPQFRSHVYLTDDRSFLEGIWNVLSTPEAWLEQGHYFFEREFYRAAMDCYKNGGDINLFTKASAFSLEKDGNYLQAALNFEKIGEAERAAQNYEKACDYRRALPLWERLNNEERAFHCQTEAYKKEGQYQEAGDLYLKKGMYKEAAQCLKKSGNYRKLAEVYLNQLKNIKEAAACLENAQDFEQAAELYFRLKLFEKAAELYWKSRNYPKAEAIWKKTRNTSRLMELYGRTGQNEKLFSLYEKQRDFEKATKCLKAFKDKSHILKDAENLFAQRKYFQALVRFFVMEDHKRTAECYFRLKNYDEAIRHFRLSGCFYSAGKVYEKVKDYKNALENYLDSEEDRKDSYRLASKIVRQIQDDNWIYRLGKNLFDRKRYHEASVIFFVFSNTFPEIGLCHAMRDKKEEAFQAWSKCRLVEDFIRIAKISIHSGDVKIAAQFFLSHPDEFLSKLRWTSRLYLRENSIIDLMDLYFSKEPSPPEMRIWGKLLCELDLHGEIWEKVLYYLEKSRGYNFLLDYFRTFELFDQSQYRVANARLKKDIRELEGAEDWQALAFRYHVLGRAKDFNRTLSRVRITPHNYVLFLIGEDDSYRKALDWCSNNDLLEEAAEEFLLMLRNHQRRAEIFEKIGKLNKAADDYFYAGNFPKAADLYIRLQRFATAGDAFFRQGDYRNALKMYRKQSPQNKRKIARTLERLEEFEKAIKLWQEVEDRKAVERCIRKMERAKQRKFSFPPD